MTLVTPWPQPLSMASVISRVPSRRLMARFMSAAIRAPRASDSWASSLPMDHRMMLGWLRSRRTIRSSWSMASGSTDMRRVSSMTSMPRRSQASRRAVAGGLWAARQALEPMVLSRSTRKACSRSGTATPTPAWSWWLQVPFSFTDLSLRKKPVCGSKRMLRTPKGVS